MNCAGVGPIWDAFYWVWVNEASPIPRLGQVGNLKFLAFALSAVSARRQWRTGRERMPFRVYETQSCMAERPQTRARRSHRRDSPRHPSFPRDRTRSTSSAAVHEALEKLAAVDAEKAEVVKLRYFVGMSVEETAEALGISERTARRHWTFARAWLFDSIRQGMVGP